MFSRCCPVPQALTVCVSGQHPPHQHKCTTGQWGFFWLDFTWDNRCMVVGQALNICSHVVLAAMQQWHAGYVVLTYKMCNIAATICIWHFQCVRKEENVKTTQSVGAKSRFEIAWIIFSFSHPCLCGSFRMWHMKSCDTEDKPCRYSTNRLAELPNWYLILRGCIVHDRSAKLCTSATYTQAYQSKFTIEQFFFRLSVAGMLGRNLILWSKAKGKQSMVLHQKDNLLLWTMLT